MGSREMLSNERLQQEIDVNQSNLRGGRPCLDVQKARTHAAARSGPCDPGGRCALYQRPAGPAPRLLQTAAALFGCTFLKGAVAVK